MLGSFCKFAQRKHSTNMQPSVTSSNGTYKTDWNCVSSSGGYIYSSTRFECHIIHVPTGKIVHVLHLSEVGDATSTEYSGVQHVEFSPESTAIITNYNQKDKQIIQLK